MKATGQPQPLAVFEREFAIGVVVSIPATAAPGELVLPADIAEDDFIEFSTVGAYGAATATRFNGYGTSAMAIVEDVFSG